MIMNSDSYLAPLSVLPVFQISRLSYRDVTILAQNDWGEEIHLLVCNKFLFF